MQSKDRCFTTINVWLALIVVKASQNLKIRMCFYLLVYFLIIYKRYYKSPERRKIFYLTLFLQAGFQMCEMCELNQSRKQLPPETKTVDAP